MNWTMGADGIAKKSKNQLATAAAFKMRKPGNVQAQSLTTEEHAKTGMQFIGRSRQETKNIMLNRDQTFEKDRFIKGKFTINARRRKRGAAASILGAPLNEGSGLGI